MKSLIATLALCMLVSLPAYAEAPRYGAMLDLGLPDGAVASFAYRAHKNLTTHAGVGHNTNSVGLRAGARWTFIPSRVAPYLALEGGHYFQAQTPSWMRDIGKSAGLKDKTLDRVGYQYASGHLGVALGSGNLNFYLQAGISFVRADTLVIKPKPNYIPPVDLYRDTRIHAWLLSGRSGVAYYF